MKEEELTISCTQAHFCNAPLGLLLPLLTLAGIVVIFIISGCFWCCCCCCCGRCCRTICPCFKPRGILRCQINKWARLEVAMFSCHLKRDIHFRSVFNYNETFKCEQKLLIIGSKNFSVFPTGPKSAQISYFFPKNGSLREFYTMTLNLTIGDENDCKYVKISTYLLIVAI